MSDDRIDQARAYLENAVKSVVDDDGVERFYPSGEPLPFREWETGRCDQCYTKDVQITEVLIRRHWSKAEPENRCWLCLGVLGFDGQPGDFSLHAALASFFHAVDKGKEHWMAQQRTYWEVGE